MSRRPPLAFIFAMTLTGILNNTLVTPALPDILDDLGVSPERSGILVAAGSTAGIVMAPVVGILADRYGRRLVLTACLAVFGTFGGVAALAPTFPSCSGPIPPGLRISGPHQPGRRPHRRSLVGNGTDSHRRAQLGGADGGSGRHSLAVRRR
jgi:MFS family permease